MGAIVFAAASAALICFAVKKKKSVLCAAGVLCGVLLMTAYMRFYCDPILEYAGKTVNAQIFVRDITERSGQSEEIVAKIKLDGRTAKLRLSCEEALPEDHTADVTIEFDEAGVGISVDDLSNGILLTGEITEIRSSEYVGADIYSVFRVIRKNFCGGLAENVFGDSEDLAAAMLFGESGKLSPKYTEYLRVSGAAHYTAVSGAHFAVLAAALLAVIPQRRRKTRFLISLMFAPAGLLFFGVSPSVLRASVMFFLYSLGMLLHRKTQTLNSLCIAVTVIPTFSPFTVADAGFAMSVLGVFGVGVVGPAFSEKLCEFIPDKAKRVLSPTATALTCSACAVICTSPISAALFKGVSLVGAVTSLLLVPFITAAMIFMLLLGVTGIRLFAIPIDWSMRVAAFIVKAFGKCRALSLALDYKGAWILTSLFAIVVAFCAFGDLKTFARFVKIAGVLAVIIPAVSVITVINRHEIRFVGNTYSSAAIVFNKNSAAVFIAGGGDGLSESISRVLREHGAVKITSIAAYDADYGGALAIKELSEMLPIGEVLSNGLAQGLLPELAVVTEYDEKIFSTDGVTIAAATASEPVPEADILLYGGQMNNIAESSARAAVYFTKAEYELPGNYHNARVDSDFCIRLG